MMINLCNFSILVLFCTFCFSDAFLTNYRSPTVSFNINKNNNARDLFRHRNSNTDNEGIVELIEDRKVETTQQAPFLSQGPVENSMSDLLSTSADEPKQTRVILYIIVSLIPVLFLIPLMIGSRDLIPLDSLPPVEL